MHSKQTHYDATQISELTKAVQHNCHIADASHAGDYTLCVYLLKMRELYRWEQDKPFSTNLPNETVGAWLRKREELWNNLESSDYHDIHLGEHTISPFDSDLINGNLQNHQLVYSGGLGLNNRPHFFLAELEVFEQHNDYDLYIVGKEYARDMSAPPAMSLDKTIYIRKESFQRLLWEKLETWRWNKPDNALGRAFAYYDCELNLDQALSEMCDCEIENVIQHEQGEIKAGRLLGPTWEELLYELPHSKVALYLRALRDMLADHLMTLPNLLKKQHAPSIHFYFGNLTNLRKDLSPQLIQAYQHWFDTGSFTHLQSIIETGQKHWASLCNDVLELYKQDDPDNQQALAKIQQLIEDNRL